MGPGAVTRDGSRIPVNVEVQMIKVAAGTATACCCQCGGHVVKLGEEEFTLYRDEDILGKFQLKYRQPR